MVSSSAVSGIAIIVGGEATAKVAAQVAGVTVFAAGVGADSDCALVTAGGRVLTVTGRGPTVDEARHRAYEAVAEISWPGMCHRTDIAAAPTGD
jgi:phosphoribosylamine--glycine ligase